MKVRALPKFEGIKDLERDVFPKAGDEWITNKERALFLKEYGVVEIVGEDESIVEATIITEPITEVKKEKKKKTSKK